MPDKANRLKVLHIIPSVAACRGGPSKAVVEMVKNLCDIGIDAEIATTNDDGPNQLNVSLNTLVDYKGAPTRFFKRLSPPVNAIREFAYSGSFRRWLSKHICDYDVIHVHAVFSYCSSYAMALARKNKIPYVVRPIGQLQHWSLQQSKAKKTIYLNLIERANLESASAVQFTADAEKQEALEFFALNDRVIPLGISLPETATLSKDDLLRACNLPATEKTVLYLSRLHEKKGLELLMQALSAIKDQDYKLLIAGNGEQGYKDKLRSLSKRLCIDHRCHFLGHVEGDKKEALLQHSDLYALTSYSENFGISVLEAMASGLTPLISSEVALSAVIQQNNLGLICSTDVLSIESQLRFAFNNPQEISLMGDRAQQYAAKHYSWPNIAVQLKHLYQSIS